MKSLSLLNTQRPIISGAILTPCLALRPGSLEQIHVEPSAQLDYSAIASGIVKHQGASLQHLSLLPANPQLTDAIAEVIAMGCRRLVTLKIPFASQLTDAGVGAIVTGPAAAFIQTLHLSRSSVMNGSTLAAMSGNCHALRELRLRGCHAACTSAAGVDALDILRQRGVRVVYLPQVIKSMCPLTVVSCCGADSRRSVVCTTTTFTTSTTASAASARNSPSCINGCGAALKHGDQSDHDQLCLHAPVLCPLALHGCDAVIPRKALGAHMAQCPKWLVTCLWGCGEWCSRVAIHAHMEAHCTKMEAAAMQVRCPLSYMGCQYVQNTEDLVVPTVAEHLQRGDCLAATYVCASCGSAGNLSSRPLPHTCRTRTCHDSACNVSSLIRGRFPQCQPLCRPPPQLLRGINTDDVESVFGASLPPPPAPRQLPLDLRLPVLAYHERYRLSAALWLRHVSDSNLVASEVDEQAMPGISNGVIPGIDSANCGGTLQAGSRSPSLDMLSAILRRRPIEIASAGLEVEYTGAGLITPDGHGLSAVASITGGAHLLQATVDMSSNLLGAPYNYLSDGPESEERVAFPAISSAPFSPLRDHYSSGGAWAGPGRLHRPMTNPIHRLTLQQQAQHKQGSGAGGQNHSATHIPYYSQRSIGAPPPRTFYPPTHAVDQSHVRLDNAKLQRAPILDSPPSHIPSASRWHRIPSPHTSPPPAPQALGVSSPSSTQHAMPAVLRLPLPLPPALPPASLAERRMFAVLEPYKITGTGGGRVGGKRATTANA